MLSDEIDWKTGAYIATTSVPLWHRSVICVSSFAMFFGSRVLGRVCQAGAPQHRTTVSLVPEARARLRQAGILLLVLVCLSLYPRTPAGAPPSGRALTAMLE